MDWKLRKEIELFTSFIRNVYNIQIPVTNIDEIVQTIGGKVVEDANLVGLDGLLYKNSDSSFEIHVSPSQPLSRRNFTIAHELGHLFLHMGYNTVPDLWERQQNAVFFRNGNSEQEYQANEFAAAFLMPEDSYREQINLYEENGMVATNRVAEYFNVSTSAASNRGKWLGILEW